MLEWAAIAAARLAAVASRGLRLGGGTTLPGRIALALAPRIVSTLSSRLPRGGIVVSGTNGKTTTARLLGGILAIAALSASLEAIGVSVLTSLQAVPLEQASAFG